mmetsp:Transcript_3293/g.7386  ORF Transcript_3293/g.7386 Transcript_3293/m.7386 type:complete len:97 (-) Transcript_3293:267-557(-)
MERRSYNLAIIFFVRPALLLEHSGFASSPANTLDGTPVACASFWQTTKISLASGFLIRLIDRLTHLWLASDAYGHEPDNMMYSIPSPAKLLRSSQF